MLASSADVEGVPDCCPIDPEDSGSAPGYGQERRRRNRSHRSGDKRSVRRGTNLGPRSTRQA